MLKLEDIKPDIQVSGLLGSGVATILRVKQTGIDALTVYYQDVEGQLGEQMLFRADEAKLELTTQGRSWAFDAPGEEFKLGLEALRISHAALFDPMMAVHTSAVEPFPHQVSAVYESMLPLQPLRFVLADDPGAGKTIMAGLLIRELIMRSDAQRILIVSPGALTEQWQDELAEKFGLRFEIFSREKQEQCASGNYFSEQSQLICRLDQLARSDDHRNKLERTTWDIIIVDEAHKLSASYFGQKTKLTKRFQLGQLLGSITRHFLLLTATPHNGKEEDFQLWLSLLDPDRFYGKFREKAHKVDVSDIMRRMVKEDLLKFDGTPLFPERRAYSLNYQLSDAEQALYETVTDYVRHEMNRADKLGDRRRGTVGFALTLLQRRLASSPEAIHQSLVRRRKRLEAKLDQARQTASGRIDNAGLAASLGTDFEASQLELLGDYDDAEAELTAEEYEHYAELVIDQATAAETIPELEAEIKALEELERQARGVVRSHRDKKWEELSDLLSNNPAMRSATGRRYKLIVFTEHKDTLNYLVHRIGNLLGDPKAVTQIHGGIARDARRMAQEEFRNNSEVVVLVATDAAGEGVNLQNANLMVNYDLPWNPNRIEQRFGRIHRIGQTEVCHMWNLVASQTREGEVFARLFKKLEVEKQSLGGKVFDVLGEAFEEQSLRALLVEAIRYGEQPEVRARLDEAIDNTLDTERLREIMRRSALVEQNLELADLYAIKEDMDRAEARKLQPYFIRAFFTEAFGALKGELRPRELKRFEVNHVPEAIRRHDQLAREGRTPVLSKYERICFDKELVKLPGKPLAEFVHPGHSLMDAVTELTLMTHRGTLKQGAVLVDPNDAGIEPRILLMLDHTIREAGGSQARVASRRVQFVEVDQNGQTTHAGWAPHLDLKPSETAEVSLVEDVINAEWVKHDLEDHALKYASENLVPEHYREVQEQRTRQADKIEQAVRERLVKEINHLSDEHARLTEAVKAGKKPKKSPERVARQIDDLSERLKQRTQELEAMKSVVPSTPIVVGGALVIPQGLLAHRQGDPKVLADVQSRQQVEQAAMHAVMAAEQRLGNQVQDVSDQKCGWDITSRPPANPDGSLQHDRHIEVKGRAKGQATVTVSRNEIVHALNQQDKFILAIVVVDGDSHEGPYYIRSPFSTEPEFGVASVNYTLKELLAKSVSPEKTV